MATRASSPSSAMAKLAHDHDAGPDALPPCPRARRQSVSGSPVKRSGLIFAAKLAMRLPGNVGFGPPPAGQAGPFAFLPFAAPPDQDLRGVGRDLQTFKLVAGKIYFFSVPKLYPQVWPYLGEGAVRSPLPEAPPCRHVVSQRTGQIAPTATCREHMQNGFQSLPVIGRRTPPRLWPRKEWPDMLPLCVGEPVCCHGHACRCCVMPRDAGPTDPPKRHGTGRSAYCAGKAMGSVRGRQRNVSTTGARITPDRLQRKSCLRHPYRSSAPARGAENAPRIARRAATQPDNRKSPISRNTATA